MNPNGAPRKYPEPKIGDLSGNVRVVALLGRGHRGRSDLRIEVECVVCERRAETYEFNFRQKPNCAGRGGRAHGPTTMQLAAAIVDMTCRLCGDACVSALVRLEDKGSLVAFPGYCIRHNADMLRPLASTVQAPRGSAVRSARVRRSEAAQ